MKFRCSIFNKIKEYASWRPENNANKKIYYMKWWILCYKNPNEINKQNGTLIHHKEELKYLKSLYNSNFIKKKVTYTKAI